MDTIIAFFKDLSGAPFDLNVRYSLFYLCCTVLIAFGLWCYRGRPQSFFKWLLPGEVYLHRSNLLDIKLFLTSRLFFFAGIFSAVFFPVAVAYLVLHQLSGEDYAPPPITWQRGLAATFIIVLVSDFCKYWAHRAHHEWKFLWPFHAVHHSADVLTPLTVQRTHPIEPIIRNLLMTVLVGLVQGLVLYGLMGQINITTIGGANALYFLFNALGANFRHSHIWISYGPVLEHILISPAQHQVHHSVATKHHDKNYGSMFAIWDWMFGTLYVPSAPEKLTFGVCGKDGKPAAQPYPTLRAALLNPFRESWQVMKSANNTSPKPLPTQMSEGFSLWLDVLRAGAAFVVLFGHMAHVRFTRGDYYFLRDWNVASDAVAVFFVLSGVVIAYAAGRDGTLGRFAFNRVTRVASVLVPALILTLMFDAYGTRIDMSAYQAPFYIPLPTMEFLWRGLTVTNLWTGLSDGVRLGTNGPIWSLSYEVGFYLIFGTLFFLRGLLRLVVLALLAVLVGIPILALFPAWWIGVMIWRNTHTMPPLRAWMLTLGAPLVLIWCKLAGLPGLLEDMTARALYPINHDALLLYSDEVLWNTLIAALIALHLIGVRQVSLNWQINRAGGFARSIRWLAGGSFSLYLMHYPTLHLLDATLPETLPGYDLWMLGITLSVCFGFAALFERPIKRYRRGILALWHKRTGAAPAQNTG